MKAFPVDFMCECSLLCSLILALAHEYYNSIVELALSSKNNTARLEKNRHRTSIFGGYSCALVRSYVFLRFMMLLFEVIHRP